MTYLPRHLGLVLSLSLLLSACSRPPAVDAVAVGQDVAVTKADGGVVQGKVASVDDTNVHVTAGPTATAIPKKQIVDVKVVDKATAVDLPPAAKFREYTVPAGTPLSLRLTTAINSGTNRVEDQVDAALAETVTVGSADVLPTGSIVKGMVSAVQASAKVKGLASITVQFTSVAAAGRDDHYDIDATYARTADSSRAADATKIGIGAGAGAAIGALLGGKSGAAKGAVIGGGAGTAAVLTTKGEEVPVDVCDCAVGLAGYAGDRQVQGRLVDVGADAG